MFNVKDGACNDKPLENYHLTLQLTSDVQSILASLSILAF